MLSNLKHHLNLDLHLCNPTPTPPAVVEGLSWDWSVSSIIRHDVALVCAQGHCPVHR